MPRPKKQMAKPVKRTVVLDALVDEYVRETWSLLAKNPDVYDATYSLAINFMLIGALLEAHKRKGWAKATRDDVWSFATDRTMAEELKAREAIEAVKGLLMREEQAR